MQSITSEMLKSFSEDYHSNPQARLMTAACSKTELPQLACSPADAALLQDTFSVQVKTHGITNQKQSGRCWLFASMNVMREKVIEACSLEGFELSGNYLAFYDKLEKINYFLGDVINTADLPIRDRTLDHILSGMQDGGQWDMMVSIIKKYGIVPASVMPETYQSCHTRYFTQQVNTKLRHDAIRLRKCVLDGGDAEALRMEMLSEYYRMLCISFGEPPAEFDFAYRDKEDVYHVDAGLTPREFYDRYVGIALEDYVSIIHSPTTDKPYYRTFTVRHLGNVAEDTIRYLNLPMEELKALTIRQMQDGEPVWFGSDCGKFSQREDGIWDPGCFLYEELFGGISMGMTKEERLDYRESAMNHAMMLCGVNLNAQGLPDRWKIENSWGEDAGRKGYYVASDAWFDAFTYQVVINKKYLNAAQLAALGTEPIELEPWDPMGTLA